MAPPAESRPATVVRVGVVDSTQSIAWSLADAGAADGTAVVAEAQSAGRGRRGRRWHAEPGSSLLASVVLRPRLAPARLPALSLVVAVSVARALERLAGLAPRLKWPNDVLVGGRKIAGVLLESRLAAAPCVVAGIGVNLGQRAFPPELASSATSVALEGGRPSTPGALLEAVLAELGARQPTLEAEGFAPLRAEWVSLSDSVGRVVTAEQCRGIVAGVDDEGALLLREGSVVHRVIAGEVLEEIR